MLGPTAGWALLFTTLAAMLGLGIGMISRNSAAAISGLLVWWMVVEQLVLAFADYKVARYLPFAAGNRLLDIDGPDEGLRDLLSRPAAAAIFAGYAVVVAVVGAFLFHRRDA